MRWGVSVTWEGVVEIGVGGGDGSEWFFVY